MLKLGVSQRDIIKISKKGDFRDILHENLLKPKIANSGNICKKKGNHFMYLDYYFGSIPH